MRSLSIKKLKSSRGEDILYLLSWLLLFASYVAAVIFVAKRSDYLLDSDMSSDMLLSKILSERGGILTDRWSYSSEIRVFHIQLITSLLFRFMGNWHYIRTVTTAVHLVLYMLSLRFLCGQLDIKRLFPITGAVLLAPVSFDYFTYYIIGLYYIPAQILMFLSLGMFIRVSRIDVKKPSKREYAEVLLAMFLAFLSGLCGIRLIALFYFPLFITFLFIFLKDRTRKAEMFQSASLLLLSGGGFLIYRFVLMRHFDVMGFDFIRFRDMDLSYLSMQLRFLMMNMGYYPGPVGFFSVTRFFVFVFFVLLAVIAFRYGRGEKNGWTLSFIAWDLAVYFVIQLLFTKDTISRYITPLVILSIPVIAGTLVSRKVKEDKLLRILSVVMSAYIAINGFSWFFEYRKIDITYDKRSVLAYMQASDIHVGYSTFWNANVITELSDGDVTMYHFSDSETMDFRDPSSVRPWLQETSHREGFPDEPSVLILTRDEYERAPFKEALDERKTAYYSGDLYVFYFEDYHDLISVYDFA